MTAFVMLQWIKCILLFFVFYVTVNQVWEKGMYVNTWLCFNFLEMLLSKNKSSLMVTMIKIYKKEEIMTEPKCCKQRSLLSLRRPFVKKNTFISAYRNDKSIFFTFEYYIMFYGLWVIFRNFLKVALSIYTLRR